MREVRTVDSALENYSRRSITLPGSWRCCPGCDRPGWVLRPSHWTLPSPQTPSGTRCSVPCIQSWRQREDQSLKGITARPQRGERTETGLIIVKIHLGWLALKHQLTNISETLLWVTTEDAGDHQGQTLVSKMAHKAAIRESTWQHAAKENIAKGTKEGNKGGQWSAREYKGHQG